jgi:hypothetical protein
MHFISLIGKFSLLADNFGQRSSLRYWPRLPWLMSWSTTVRELPGALKAAA